MSGNHYAVQYDGGQATKDGFRTPRTAVAWARTNGLSDFAVVRPEGPEGFYSHYRTYCVGRLATDGTRTARQGCGRGFGYGPRMKGVS